MKYVHIDSVEPGQILGKAIFSSNGTVLLSENVELTVYMINTLRRIGVTMLYIRDELFDDVEVEDIVSEENKRLVIRRMAETFEAIRSGKEFDTRNLSFSIDKLLEDVLQNRNVLVQLSDIRTHDNALYIHALNVCIMSTLVGINLGLNQTQLKELAIGALLHDIGKVGLDPEEEKKDPRNHHAWKGFDILKQKREYSLLTAHVAFQHHEALDGSGEPRGLTDEQIHLYPKIVAIANTYDNLLSHSGPRKGMLPHEACEHLNALAGSKLDHDLLIHFLKVVSVYPTGTSVRLTTKETGVVVGQHRGLPGRPIVRVVTRQGDSDISVKEVDLAKHTTVFIEAVLT
jgi:HD-GYP domain-containing protein (c-di-GMP phosphodiesterase class II)